MIPGIDGFRVLRALRENGRKTPVLVLAARGEEADKVRGLRLGADDYVTKPFGLLEFLARVEALPRRSAFAGQPPPPEPLQEVYHLGEVRVDVFMRRVTRDDQDVSLTPLEFTSWWPCAAGRVAWPRDWSCSRRSGGILGGVLTRTVDTHISELRRKLEQEPSRPAYIITVRKAGYRVECEAGA
jgi:two-component system, OmpR family, alkaline phosphatase synthesis response regulator PhoP